ncbi:hypothetical protein [Mycoplasmoides pirum]|uniref:hypothetical protein n=1 Tax=Mycoplasmoides pirum TaxID=2122 RepID=UPI0004837F4E|nr:hypothetical protein [Mycoplasmoides pirum]
MNLVFNNIIYETTKEINYISLAINLSIFLLILIASIVLLTKIKLDAPGYKLLFVFYTFFWFPLMLVRSYRGTLNNDLEIDKSLLWVPLTVYGLVGIFIRPLFDFLGVHFRSRKIIVYISLGLQILTFIPLIIIPSFATNIIQAIGVGIGASCIGTFSLWFNEQHAKTKPFLTISILSLPPLLADFLASPIQSIIRSVAPYGSNPGASIHADPNFMKYLWVIALVVIFINCFIGYFLKENRNNVGLSIEVSKKKLITTNRDWIVLVGIILVGASIDFTKFATGDSIATLTIQDIGGAENTAPFEGYVSAIFSGFQLMGGILMGLVLTKYVSKNLIYIFGAMFFIFYNMSTILITQQNYPNQISGAIAFLGIQFLNGFGFGILYNLLIAHVLSLSFKTKKFSPLGLYQSFASLSIACGTFFTSFIKGFFQQLDYAYVVLVISSILIGITILMGIVYYFVNYLEVNCNHKELWKINFKKIIQ